MSILLTSVLPSFDALFDGSPTTTSETSFINDILPTELLSSDVPGLRIVHHNIQGIVSKVDELNMWFNASADSATIYCLSETWLKSNSPNLTFPGFTTFTSPFPCHPGRERHYLPSSCMMIPNSVIPH